MVKPVIAGMVLALALFAGLAPGAAAQRGNGYYEWSTKRPFSGWVGFGRRRYYCDYIRYPVRDCRRQRVCRSGRCWTEENCRVVGWDIRQSCY